MPQLAEVSAKLADEEAISGPYPGCKCTGAASVRGERLGACACGRLHRRRCGIAHATPSAAIATAVIAAPTAAEQAEHRAQSPRSIIRAPFCGRLLRFYGRLCRRLLRHAQTRCTDAGLPSDALPLAIASSICCALSPLRSKMRLCSVVTAHRLMLQKRRARDDGGLL